MSVSLPIAVALGDELAKALHLEIYSAHGTAKQEEARTVHMVYRECRRGLEATERSGLQTEANSGFSQVMSSILRCV